ncbi:unnamed protein product [Cyprideis torosa]|uniref:Uncharacterized protein n=1 Tax=Cyprideis torosa TaxID=163714 RepID=A0A7R8W7E1_9CRUS|nr:unnamed protein product [Cyprideis torosa]CAG0886230.1 unnamed protein product [Cyprideis torosa]
MTKIPIPRRNWINSRSTSPKWENNSTDALPGNIPTKMPGAAHPQMNGGEEILKAFLCLRSNYHWPFLSPKWTLKVQWLSTAQTRFGGVAPPTEAANALFLTYLLYLFEYLPVSATPKNSLRNQSKNLHKHATVPQSLSNEDWHVSCSAGTRVFVSKRTALVPRELTS